MLWGRKTKEKQRNRGDRDSAGEIREIISTCSIDYSNTEVEVAHRQSAAIFGRRLLS